LLGGVDADHTISAGSSIRPGAYGSDGESTFDASCEALGLSDRGDRTNELIAQRIIELAQWGLRNPMALSLVALKELKSDS